MAGTIPANNSLLAGTVPDNNFLLARTVPPNKELLAEMVTAINLFQFYLPLFLLTLSNSQLIKQRLLSRRAVMSDTWMHISPLDDEELGLKQDVR